MNLILSVVLSTIIIILILFKIKNYNNYIRYKNIEENRWLYLDDIDIDLETMTYGEIRYRFDRLSYLRYVGVIENRGNLMFKIYKKVYRSDINICNGKEFFIFSNNSLTEEAKDYFYNYKIWLGNSPLSESMSQDLLNNLKSLEGGEPVEIDFDKRNKIMLAKAKYENLKISGKFFI